MERQMFSDSIRECCRCLEKCDTYMDSSKLDSCVFLHKRNAASRKYICKDCIVINLVDAFLFVSAESSLDQLANSDSFNDHMSAHAAFHDDNYGDFQIDIVGSQLHTIIGLHRATPYLQKLADKRIFTVTVKSSEYYITHSASIEREPSRFKGDLKIALRCLTSTTLKQVYEEIEAHIKGEG